MASLTSWSFTGSDWTSPDPKDSRYLCCLAEALKERVAACDLYQRTTHALDWLDGLPYENPNIATRFPFLLYWETLKDVAVRYYDPNFSIEDSRQAFIDANEFIDGERRLVEIDNQWWWWGAEGSVSGDTFDLLHWNLTTICAAAGIGSDEIAYCDRGVAPIGDAEVVVWIKVMYRILNQMRLIKWDGGAHEAEWVYVPTGDTPAATKRRTIVDWAGQAIPPGSYDTHRWQDPWGWPIVDGDYDIDTNTLDDLSFDFTQGRISRYASRKGYSEMNNGDYKEYHSGRLDSPPDATRDTWDCVFTEGRANLCFVGRGNSKVRVYCYDKLIRTSLIPHDPNHGGHDYVYDYVDSQGSDLWTAADTGGCIHTTTPVSKYDNDSFSGEIYYEDFAIELGDLADKPSAIFPPYLMTWGTSDGDTNLYYKYKEVKSPMYFKFGMFPDYPDNAALEDWEMWGCLLNIQGRYTTLAEESFKFRTW